MASYIKKANIKDGNKNLILSMTYLLGNSYIYFCVHKSSFLTLFNENFKQNFKVPTTENTFTQAKSIQQSSKYAGALIRNKYVDTDSVEIAEIHSHQFITKIS